MDKTEIRRRMTLQIPWQAETLGSADQEKKAEQRKAKYRSQDLSGAEKQKSEGSPRSISRQQLTHGLAGYYSRPEAASIPHQT